jgi:hypothetical protein
MDESNVLLWLLGTDEHPPCQCRSLFEGDEHAALMTACKEGSQRDGLMLDSHEELYQWLVGI